MNIKKYGSALFLSIFSAYKSTFLSSPSNVTTDAFFVPLTCALIFSYKVRRPEKRNFLGGTVGSLLYLVSVWKMATGSNKLNKEICLLVNCLGIFIAYIFKYLISKEISANVYSFCFYLLSLILCSIFILKDLDFSGYRIFETISDNLHGIMSYVIYTIITNIITNEIGIIDYIFYSSFITILFWALISLFLPFGNLYKDNILDIILYYAVSLVVYLSTIAYTQMYGIISINYLHIINLMIFLLIKLTTNEIKT
ncbi:uncharacterized protein VNE69_01373 [Vairimorpha necatrix]|uniref:Membrane protein n=1 Tax=Vairimorpha necatrix TaxID=6039 RepID=A0AAX4J973_9MICR